MRILLTLLFIISTALRAGAQYPNVVIGTSWQPNEPSICINPHNPQQVVAGGNIDNYYYSSDGGQTWTGGTMTSTLGVWGDPMILADTAGHFYFFHLSTGPGNQFLDRIVCQKSLNGGATWNNGSYMGLNNPKDQDKEWAVVEPSTNIIYATWTQFDTYGSASPADSSHILFSRSTDGGLTWSPAVRIDRYGGDCLDSDNTVEGAVPAVGPNGEVYVAWTGPQGLVFTRSTDRGLTWPAENKVITDIPGGWDFAIPGIYRANGLPVTCCDLSEGPGRGNIYINWSDQRNGETDTDIWFVRSDDGGTTWTAPKRINDDPPGRQQFFTWMTVDRQTGYIWMVFYDRRNHTGNLTDVYMAVSRDGGDTFTNFKVSESPFNPEASVFFGDYNNVSAVGNRVRPVWTRLENGNLSVVTALVDSVFTGIAPEKQAALPFSLEQNYPNPVSDITRIAYKLHTPATVSLKVYDLVGHEVAVLVDHAPQEAGRHIESFSRRQYGLPPGLYSFSLVSNDQVINRKMIVE